ncbi:NADH-dependent flavin oxidoreductase [Bacillus altitudinis]|uniref:NADH-dependent flavin oxidoreductase n=1 Tax=Bacillus altitudinis TaxID=293387 RepID=UPI001F4600AD|nr:NADH-dependent flavin oxidoreductase [Bacillus altitudinis]
MKNEFKPLFEPFTFPGGASIDGRLVVAPMTHFGSHEDGTISKEEIDFITARSSEMGMVITACANVTPDGKAFEGQPSIARDEDIPGLQKLASAIQAKGTKAIMQIHHGGSQALPHLVPNGDVVAPSDVFKDGKQIARALTEEEIPHIIDSFKEAARRAIQAGFDGIEIHGANGYLLQQFYSPHSNQRTDQWGGSEEKRLAFPIAVVDAVKEAIKEHVTKPFIFGYRLSPEEPETPGLTMTETFTLVDVLKTKNLDYLHISLMEIDAKARRGADTSKTRMELLKERCGDTLPLIGVGSVITAEDALNAYNQGIPLIAVAREVIVDPDWAGKIKEGRENEIETVIKRSQKDKYMIPEGLWTVMEASKGWVPMED